MQSPVSPVSQTAKKQALNSFLPSAIMLYRSEAVRQMCENSRSDSPFGFEAETAKKPEENANLTHQLGHC